MAALSGAQTASPRKSDYNQLYDPRTIVTVNGKVTGIVEDNTIREGYPNSVMLLVKAANGGTSSVDLGPTWYLQNQREQVKLGDPVKISGSKVFVNNRSFVLAQQLVKGGRVLYLRELTGFPMWVSTRGKVEVTKNASTTQNPAETQGRILGVDTRQGMNGEPAQRFLVVETATGRMNILMGPEWYVANQNMQFQMGENITLRGMPRQVPGNPNMVVVDSLVYGNSVMVIQNGGRPMWLGWDDWNRG